MENNFEEPQLIKVGVQEVEEGEISDSTSVEEITEDAFYKKQTAATSNTTGNLHNVNPTSNNASGASAARVWTITDLYKYQIASKASNSGLYNLAWAQAVSNKPLGEVHVMMETSGDDNNNCNHVSEAGTENQVVIDVENDSEKEEGELEEGEIDVDSELVQTKKDADISIKNAMVCDVESGKIETGKLVNAIKQELENLDVTDAEKSYDRLCACLETTVDSLQEIILEDSFAGKGTLVEVLLSALKKLYSVFSSMTLSDKEQKEVLLSRLVEQLTSLKPPLFSFPQLKEVQVEAISASLAPVVDFSSLPPIVDLASLTPIVDSLTNTIDNGKQLRLGSEMTHTHDFFQNSSNSSSLKISGLEPASPGLLDQTELNSSLPCSKSEPISSGIRSLVDPLLDIRKDHDAGNLPSPTSRLSAPLPGEKGSIQVNDMARPEWANLKESTERANPLIHPYENEAMKAVSSYQQRFGQKSFSMKDELPSPTPSEEGNSAGDGETNGEVSSFIVHKVEPDLNSSLSGNPMARSAASTDTIASHIVGDPRGSTLSRIFENPVSKSVVKSRDPRLRLASTDSGARNFNPTSLTNASLISVKSSQKQNAVGDLVLDGPAPKRQKNELSAIGMTLPRLSAASTFPVMSPATTLPVSRTITSPLFSQSEFTNNSSGAASLHSLLRDLATNPSTLINILKMKHQSSSDDFEARTDTKNLNRVHGAVPSGSASNPPLLKTAQISAETVGTYQEEETKKIRMRPRDPRRIFLNGGSQKGVNAASALSNLNTSSDSSKIGISNTQKKEDQLEKSSVSSVSLRPPDIAVQFTSNLNDIAGLLAVSQPSMPSVPPQKPLPVQSLQAGETEGAVSECDNLRDGNAEAGSSVPSRPPTANTQCDFDHFLEGFDVKQKATILKERARRLEEQKKMFASRKLCLVLDLDHTLLNSAKFVEVDPVHDEILRKKEEQDRGKSRRHLFRFPHMGMWTKLRPGIWNFLEKASKLYELHLYTMGNKYYATEMAKLLDPSGELFSGRVISRGDDGEPFAGDDRVPKSKDLDGVMGMESSVIIIDDSVRVWPLNQPNLIVVERYIYFPCSRRQFGLPGPSLLEIDHDERPENGTLAAALAVIERIHAEFFSHPSWDLADVRSILSSEQRKILAGCRIVFSRVIPVGEANPHMHPLWQTAEQFGAVCVNQTDDQVTHVVANSHGTEKVNWALSAGKFVVHPGWVEASALLYRRANEHDFAIKQQ